MHQPLASFMLPNECRAGWRDANQAVSGSDLVVSGLVTRGLLATS